MTLNSSAGSGPPRPLSVPSDMCKPMTPGWGMRKARQWRPQHTHVACFYSLCLSGRRCRLLHRSSGSLSRVSQLWFGLKISQGLIKPSLFDQFYFTELHLQEIRLRLFILKDPHTICTASHIKKRKLFKCLHQVYDSHLC